MSLESNCPRGTDDQFGPRVNVLCRQFDFTLLFEDAFFTMLPAALFLLVFPVRLQALRHASVKLKSYKLAIGKLSLLTVLFILHVLFTAFQARSASLTTTVSLSAGVLNIIATMTAAIHSFVEDQRSVAPSDVLVIYFSVSAVLGIPRLRSLWLMPSANVCGGLWTSVYIFTVLMLFVESAKKSKLLRPLYRKLTTEQICGFWGRSFFIWVLPFFQAGYSSILGMDDIPDVDDDLQGQRSGAKLQRAWGITKDQRKRKHRLLRAAFRAYRWPFLSAVLPRLALSAFSFCQPFLLTATVNYIGSPKTSDSKKYGQALVGAYVLVYLGLAISTAVYWRQTYRFTTMLRSGLISIVYNQTVRLKASDMKESQAITLMGTDVERIATTLRVIHESWGAIIDVVVAIWLLERQISVAAIGPVLLSLLSVLAMIPVSRRMGAAQKQWNERVQKRLAITASMLGDMKAVKMLGLTKILYSTIYSLRKIEIQTSLRFRKLLMWQVLISNIPVDVTPLATFTIYALIAVVKGDRTLISAQAFTALSLISLFTFPLLVFCQTVPSILQIVACFDRIEEYCLKDPESPTASSTTSVTPCAESLEMRPGQKEVISSSSLVTFVNADISWSKESEVVLHNVNLSLQTGITMIIGAVGSGKSAFIESLLGETVVRRGSTTAPLSRAAYACQVPWIMNATIRHNIVGASEFDQKWYEFAISACGLEDDLKLIPGGDTCKAGSNGASLSGGQKQRIALARAVYSRLPLVILDDVLSGLDSRNIRLICNSLFDREGHFRQSGRSVILATHTQRLLAYADEIIVLDHGRVADRGSYADILMRNPELVSSSIVKSEEEVIETEIEPSENEGKEPSQAQTQELVANAADPLKERLRQHGSWSVYQYYVLSAGYIPVLMFVISAITVGFSTNFLTLWLQWWVEANEEEPNKRLGMYLGVYFCFTMVSVLAASTLCRFLFLNVINNSAMNLHADLLRATLWAPFSFFQKNDAGAITNRFSQDMNLVDMTLPLNVVNFSYGTVLAFAKLIIICVIGKYLAISVPFVAAAIYLIQLYYLRTSRQVRLLDIEAKAPLYTHFLESVKGIMTIRAFSWQSRFKDQSLALLNESQKPFYMLYCIQQWLTLVLDLLVAAIAVILVATATSITGKYSPASIGVALNMVLTFNQALTQAIKSWILLETSIGAVSRTQSYVQDTPSENNSVLQPAPEDNWPSKGEVVFDSVQAGYRTATKPVLDNISLVIKPGEKVAICGASGSGKTSMIMALLRMIDIQKGHVTLDGKDVMALNSDDIRSRINVIPQDPLFIPGTIRFNLNPTQRATREVIEPAIKKVGLWKRISENGGLDMELSASDWSVGERQLLALARALTLDSALLILDEATSSVDAETESIMQEVIEKEFARQTIISIVHRLRYIDRYDRVVLLDSGALVECDAPNVLLERNSEFRKLYMALKRSD